MTFSGLHNIKNIPSITEITRFLSAGITLNKNSHWWESKYFTIWCLDQKPICLNFFIAFFECHSKCTKRDDQNHSICLLKEDLKNWEYFVVVTFTVYSRYLFPFFQWLRKFCNESKTCSLVQKGQQSFVFASSILSSLSVLKFLYHISQGHFQFNRWWRWRLLSMVLVCSVPLIIPKHLNSFVACI